jgi:hypothetical protein
MSASVRAARGHKKKTEAHVPAHHEARVNEAMIDAELLMSARNT